MKKRPLKFAIHGVDIKKGEIVRKDWILVALIGPHESFKEASKTKRHLEKLIRESNGNLLLAQDEGEII